MPYPCWGGLAEVVQIIPNLLVAEINQNPYISIAQNIG
jgi:hypothetical protein